jgi:hypothetical protein
MQPYFFPYIGYFQLIAAVDLFVIYDNIKYTKRGWINRNRMLLNGSDSLFSLPLKKGSDSLKIFERELASDFDPAKLLSQFRGAYERAPYFDRTFSLLEEVIAFGDRNLFSYLYHSIQKTCLHLGVPTELRKSSDVDIDHNLRSQDKVLAISRATGASVYINSSGGMELYSREKFSSNNVMLQFIRSKPFDYAQFHGSFVPWLSIVDVLMFNPIESVSDFINTYYETI